MTGKSPPSDSNLALHLLIVQLHLLQGGCQPVQLVLHLLNLHSPLQHVTHNTCIHEWMSYSGAAALLWMY